MKFPVRVRCGFVARRTTWRGVPPRRMRQPRSRPVQRSGEHATGTAGQPRWGPDFRVKRVTASVMMIELSDATHEVGTRLMRAVSALRATASPFTKGHVAGRVDVTAPSFTGDQFFAQTIACAHGRPCPRRPTSRRSLPAAPMNRSSNKVLARPRTHEPSRLTNRRRINHEDQP